MEVLDRRQSAATQWPRKRLLIEVLKQVNKTLEGQSSVDIKITDDTIDVSLLDEERIQKTGLPGFDCNTVVSDLQRIIGQRLELLNGRAEEGSFVFSEPGRSLLKRKAEALEKDPTCPIYGHDTFNRILSLGRANGRPKSPERLMQLQKLWTENIPELHLIVSHSEEMYEKWVEEFSDLNQGQSYFLKVLSALPEQEYLRALSRVCSTMGRHKRRFDGLGDTTEVRSGLWVSRQTIQAYRVELSPRVETKDLQGFPIEIKPNGDVKIKWLTAGGAKRTLTLNSPICAIPEAGLHSRALSFTEHGIDIVDANGVALRPHEPWEKEPSPATLPRWTFKSKNGQLLQELWEAVRLGLGYSVPSNRIRGVPAQRNGVGLVPSSSETETPRQNKPPRVQDANFLLYNFLNERFPNGGIFRTISRDKDESSTEDLQAFVEFRRRPGNVDHPYSAKWLEMLDRPRPFIAILAPNMRAYRTCETQKTYPYLSHLGRHFGETIFRLGGIQLWKK